MGTAVRAVAPFLVRPRYVEKPWGGRRLATALARRDLPEGSVGESYEVADLPAARSVVETGPFEGRTLAEAWGGPFPLLVKVIDAREPLSVQVHPDGSDGTAAKEEASVALADGGEIAAGAAGPDVPAAGAWMARLARTPLLAGTADGARAPTIVHVPPGTVHAILAGALLWEVQNPVDVTWRLDDHGRTDARGMARELHLAEAAAVLRRGPRAPARRSADGRRVVGERIRVEAHPPGAAEDTRAIVAFFARGGRVEWADDASGASGVLDVPAGRTAVLTPAARRLTSPGWILAAGLP